MASNVLSGVPAAEVGQNVQSLVDEGVSKVHVSKQADGSFTITPE